MLTNHKHIEGTNSKTLRATIAMIDKGSCKLVVNQTGFCVAWRVRRTLLKFMNLDECVSAQITGRIQAFDASMRKWIGWCSFEWMKQKVESTKKPSKPQIRVRWTRWIADGALIDAFPSINIIFTSPHFDFPTRTYFLMIHFLSQLAVDDRASPSWFPFSTCLHNINKIHPSTLPS